MTKLALVTPLFNDWDSLLTLLQALNHVAQSVPYQISVFIVDDGATDPTPAEALVHAQLGAIARIEVLHLACNLGHQRAISVGMTEIYSRGGYDAVVVMDSDGEDRPEDIPQLAEALSSLPNHLIVAARAQRSEGALFRVLYKVYKMGFFALTGTHIDFGNFCLIPAEHLERLVYSSGTWNNLPATVMRSRVPVHRVPIKRGERYAGRSKMSLTSLILHGLSAVSVYSDIAFVRTFVGAAVLAVASCLGILAVFIVRFFTSLATPGWATSTAGILLIVLTQTLMFSAGAAFLVLTNRSSPLVIPAIDCARYVRSRWVIKDMA